MLTGLLMKNSRGFEIDIFGRVELNIARLANFKSFSSPGQCNVFPSRVWPGLLYRGVQFLHIMEKTHCFLCALLRY